MTSANSLGVLDRLLHRIAFATPLAQVAVADLEDRLARRALAGAGVAAPVLISGLPRSGTTILLEMLAATPELAAHTYRDMPFVLCPLAWDVIARRFRRASAPRPRAHDDGIAISADSPEAFEEIVWKRFWPDHYRDHSIAPWTTCRNDEFTGFLTRHMAKIVALRRRSKPDAARYVSKNNVTLARVPAVREILPDAIVVVPFREPIQHAASLLRQHRRFTALHASDRFARRYMAAIGHHDFGAGLKPIDFDGWLARAGSRDPDTPGFWLEYWIAAYRHVLRHAGSPGLVTVRFEALDGATDLTPLAHAIGIPPASLAAQRSRLSPARPHAVEPAAANAPLARVAAGLHRDLLATSVV